MQLALAAVSPIVLHYSPLRSSKTAGVGSYLKHGSGVAHLTVWPSSFMLNYAWKQLLKSADYMLLSILVFVTKCMRLTQNVCELAPLLQQNSCLIDLLT